MDALDNSNCKFTISELQPQDFPFSSPSFYFDISASFITVSPSLLSLSSFWDTGHFSFFITISSPFQSKIRSSHLDGMKVAAVPSTENTVTAHGRLVAHSNERGKPTTLQVLRLHQMAFQKHHWGSITFSTRKC